MDGRPVDLAPRSLDMPSLADFKSRIPWWAKVGAKLLLSRLPVAYHTWRSLGIFQHGRMLAPEYTINVFSRHFQKVAAHLPPGFVALELGPGDSLGTAVIAHAYGASRTYLIDAGPFASFDLEAYLSLCRALRARQLQLAELERAKSTAELLAAAGATYLTEGLQSLLSLPEGSVDFILSQAVLEHVLRDEFSATIRALWRLQKPGGLGSHRIDFRDHIGDSLHSLRFAPEFWESCHVRASGFYTNRLRFSQVVREFEAAGYEVLERREERWEVVPVPRARLHPTFSALSRDDLLVSGADLLVRKPQ